MVAAVKSMFKWKLLAVVVNAFLLSACASTQRQEVAEYCSMLAQSAELQPLVGKVPMFLARDITAEMMARRDVPTAADDAFAEHLPGHAVVGG